MIKIQECSSVDAFSGCNGTGGLLDTAVSAITGDAKFCDTSKSWRRVLIWIQWNGKKWAIQFYSCESCPNPLNFIIAWFSTSKEYWVSGPFFCFVSKGSNQFETQLGFTRRLKVNQALDILSGKKKKKISLPMELSVELAYFWQHLGDKCCHITKEQEQSLPLY